MAAPRHDERAAHVPPAPSAHRSSRPVTLFQGRDGFEPRRAPDPAAGGTPPAAQPRQTVALSVAVPCCNEAAVLAELHRRLTDVCVATVGQSYEIVLVNDGSRDETWAMISAFAKTDPHIVGVDLSRNYGQQLALTAALQICAGERIFIIDADLQDPPELLPEMMARMDAGCDVVYGQRIKRHGETWLKRVTSAMFYRTLDSLVDIHIPSGTGDFRLMNRRVLDVLNGMPEQNRFMRGMISWIGLRQEPIFYERAPRFAGRTNWPFAKLMLLALDAITAFSVRPLRIASWLGLGCGLFGAALLFYVFWSWLDGKAIQGWTSVMTALLLIGSCQLLVAGVMGEYLGRLYMESKHRPLFVIRDIARSASTPASRPPPDETPKSAQFADSPRR
jgi:dolichol-phosphate mannosyltransferase